jgi:hypothetical protein
MLRKVAPRSKVEKLVTKKLTLNRQVLNTLSKSGVLTKKTLNTVAMKVLKGYRKRYGHERAKGASKRLAREVAVAEHNLMVQRVQNAAVYEIAQEIEDKYYGEKYEWLPSDAKEADPLHQLNYGKIFTLGQGEKPGDREGCQCGMLILTDDEKLEL